MSNKNQKTTEITTKNEFADAFSTTNAVDHAMTKTEIIRHIASETGQTLKSVEDFYNSLVDLALREVLVSGAFSMPGLMSIHRVFKEETIRYQKNNNLSILYPSTCTVRTKAGRTLKEAHKRKYRNLNNAIYDQEKESWFSNRIICEGDWKEKSQEEIIARIREIKKDLGEL